jgi:hypothetical protein
MRSRIRASQPQTTQTKLLFCIVLALALLPGGQVGCSNAVGPDPCKNPEDCKPPDPPDYPIRNSPIKAVEYLQKAWEDRDSTRADSVLNVEYQGTSSELGTNPGTLSFVKSDEIRALHNLKDSPDVSDIKMNFPPQGAWILDQDSGDPPDWVIVKVNNPEIVLTEADGDIQRASSTYTNFEFKARPISTGGQILWEIVRWKEVHVAPPNGS